MFLGVYLSRFIGGMFGFDTSKMTLLSAPSMCLVQINPSYSYAQKVTMITRLTDTLASS